MRPVCHHLSGETILTTGRTATEYMNSGLTFVVFCSAFISTVAMWWIYFHHGQAEASRKAENADEKAKIAHNLFNYGHLPIVAGIILTAVGEDFSLSHAHEAATIREAIAIVGGPVLFWQAISVSRSPRPISAPSRILRAWQRSAYCCRCRAFRYSSCSWPARVFCCLSLCGNIWL